MARQCRTCAAELPAQSRFCGQCGTPVLDPGVAVETATLAGVAAAPQGAPSRFAPGEVIAGRYQVIDLLGAGGMGEVYRANDLTLQQPVALKFLSTVRVSAPHALIRFRSEVRLARQVSHPNVCRVYDIGTAGDQTFLTMEYIDGEDLASLLRRIGRLPVDKALEIARGLCLGLAAAHDRSVLHRDLKPSNIMVNARGQVVITDFGLAALEGQLIPGQTREGTPAYMAPEQLAAKEVTAKSDLYALGLVLYEVFTGRRAFESNSAAELLRLEESSSPTRPSSLVRDLDVRIERVILRCLASDPAKRPASAAAVLAALPGGDPLEAALAAGETPSPEMVAAAGQEEQLTIRTVLICAVSAAAGVLAFAVLNGEASPFARIPFAYPPEVLRVKAQEIIAAVGYSERPADSAYGFSYDPSFTRLQDPQRAARLLAPGQRQYPPVWFWYRQRPQALVPTEFDHTLVNKSLPPGTLLGRVSQDDPRETSPGSIELTMDTAGRLCAFRAFPAPGQPAVTSAAADWNRAFAAAGLDSANFAPSAPSATPGVVFDSRAAWRERAPPAGQAPLLVTAAAWHGRLVDYTVGEFAETRRSAPPHDPSGFLVLLMILLVAPAPIAIRNLREGRGDRRGALRLAALCFSTYVLIWIIGGTHVAGAEEIRLLMMAVSMALFFSLTQAMVYMALEPYVRRRWPRILIGWSRVIAGQLMDARVGRELLAGATAGVLMTLHMELARRLFWHLPDTEAAPDALLHLRHLVAELLMIGPDALNKSLAVLFFVFVFRLLVRNGWAACALAAAMFTVLFSAGSNALVWEINLVFCVGMPLLLMRFGLLSVIAALFTTYALRLFPATADLSVWYAPNAVFGCLAVLALVAFGARSALAGRRLLGDSL